MEDIIFLVEEDVEDGFTAKGLGVAIFTEGETIDDLQKKIKDDILCHFDEQQPKRLVKLQIMGGK